MTIRFGPAGLGGVKQAISNLERYHKLGFKACEVAFGRGVYIKNNSDAKRIGKAAKKLGIRLSIHAPYWVNLNSHDKEVTKKSKERILRSCEIGTYLGAYRVVFHPGYYNKISREETYENIKREILDIKKTIKEKKYTPKLAPETTGKINVFGSVDEIKKLVDETGCEFCIDFAHILAREKDYKFKEVFEKFKEHDKIHVHFSGITYSEKGEISHKKTSEEELKKLISNLPKNKEINVINESPDSVEDSILSLKIYRR
ncbi:MAG TPA: endonuclease IV [Candidatus Pacearchaeota archaeon]|nr:endonuclease IV [archaeon BMS3Abin17]HDK42613.1 endonuclease IV [Candidatus Pacearchaeota archaeon]HDZ61422.1 endonuclease IV [Candidatus Pacearchaeota archaeon]